MKWTVRVKLTALYGGLFIATTTTLLVIVNLLLQRIISRKLMTLVYRAGPAVPGEPDFIRDQHQIPDEMKTAMAGQELRDSVARYQWDLTWIAVCVLAVIGIATGWWLAGRVLRPLHVITATAQRLSLANLSERIALTGPRDELKELADTFDAMLDRLEQAADSQRRFIANASHELRTPLAIQRAAIEIGLEDPNPEQLVRMKAELLHANERTEKLIDGLLVLAQGERGLYERGPVELDALAEEVVEHHQTAAQEAEVVLDLDLEPVTVAGDAALLSRLIANLVHNAIRYNQPGGHIQIRTSPASGITVSNTGPEIPADRIPELFEPFRRLHQPRTGPSDGAGLGLSIVAAIAAAHGAYLTASPNPGGGLIVGVSLPALVPA